MQVGVTGFEPATAWSQTRSATGLRYAPKTFAKLIIFFSPTKKHVIFDDFFNRAGARRVNFNMKAKLTMGRLPLIVLAIAAILVCLSLVRRCNISPSTLSDDYIKPSADTLAVAIEMSPMTYFMRHDTAEGFDYCILRDIGLRHGIEMTFHPVSDLDRAFRGLNDGEYDILVASMPATKTLKEYFPLTDAVYIDRQVLVQRRNADSTLAVTSQQQLRGDTVWIADGSPFRTRLRNLGEEMGDSIVVLSMPEYSAEHLVIMTALGQIKRAVVNQNIARHMAADYHDLDFSVPISFSQFQVWALAPGDSILLDSMNTWLREFRQTAAYDSLAAKYL